VLFDIKSKGHNLVVSRVNLKLKFRKGNYLSGSFDVGRLQDEDLLETFHEQLNTKLESLKFYNEEDAWNNFRKTIQEVADGFLGKKVKTVSRNIK